MTDLEREEAAYIGALLVIVALAAVSLGIFVGAAFL